MGQDREEKLDPYISSYITKDMNEQINKLITEGKYKNRSQFVREAIRRQIQVDLRELGKRNKRD